MDLSSSGSVHLSHDVVCREREGLRCQYRSHVPRFGWKLIGEFVCLLFGPKSPFLRRTGG